MSRATKRLRRKTTVSQKGCSELMMLTSEWWMQFLLPVGRDMPAVYVSARIRYWRLLCKAWREVWDQGFRIKLIIHEACVSDLCHAARLYDDLKFSRDSCNGRMCVATMPWKTFKGLRPFLSRLALMDRLHTLHSLWASFNVVSCAQTAFSQQRRLRGKLSVSELSSGINTLH